VEIASFDHRANHLAKRHVEPPDELAPRPLTPREHSLQQRGVIEPRQVVALALLGSAPRPARGRTSRERDSAHRIADLASAPKNEATEIRDGIARMSAAAARRAPLAGDAGAGLLGPGQQRHGAQRLHRDPLRRPLPTGYALNGFNLAATNEIDNDKPSAPAPT